MTKEVTNAQFCLLIWVFSYQCLKSAYIPSGTCLLKGFKINCVNTLKYPIDKSKETPGFFKVKNNARKNKIRHES